MTTYLILLIVYIVFVLLFAGLISFYIMLSTMLNSNKFGNSKGKFYNNTKQPMRIHELTAKEYYKDMQENPEQYGVIKIF